jgi:hypothetical protein
MNQIVSALSEDEIVESNLLATVTRNCVIIPNANGHAQSVIALSRISSVRHVKSSYPGLVVIAGALGLIAAAAVCSKEGHGAAWPIALLGAGFAIAYLGTRRGSVTLSIGSGPTETVETTSGSLREAAAIAAAIQDLRSRPEHEAAVYLE